ncbi:MAG TPA: hydroxyacylglutathione hydrolase [Acidiferrobacteraceae bacterium]|nr:hydroxyacylglutathione hydrolase [Acidiferrobacteraceae bacterium]
MIEVLHVDAFEDNYIWLIRSPDDASKVAIVDPGDEMPVYAALKKHALTPLAILCTHHHGDHIGGIGDILSHYPIPVFGPAQERIPGVTHRLKQGDPVDLHGLGLHFEVLDVPGHTLGHIAYYGHGMLFGGDTLFSAGCGRLFEGTAEQMSASLNKLRALPNDTQVYCAHEYTADNLRFALELEPNNPDLLAYIKKVEELRRARRPTLPTSINAEKSFNPFLRSTEPTVKQAAETHCGHALHSPEEVFAEIRRWKDRY